MNVLRALGPIRSDPKKATAKCSFGLFMMTDPSSSNGPLDATTTRGPEVKGKAGQVGPLMSTDLASAQSNPKGK